MKNKAVILLLGVMLCVTACGGKQAAQEPVQQETEAAKEAETEAAAETEAPAEEEDDGIDYVEDMVLSTDLITITVPEEFKGKFLAAVDGDSVSFYDKASHEGGFGGYAFSVVVDKNKDLLPGGMYTKVGELLTAQGERYNVCKGYPSDVQWDYTASEEMPEDYSKLYNSADQVIEGAKAVGDATFMYGAGTKGEELYQYTVSRYVDAINEGWDANKFEEENMSPEFYALAKSEGDKALDKIGFAYRDISSDGVDELLVGVIGDSGEPSVVYDIYTMVDGAPALVVSGTARNRYYALEYSGFANIRSEGAGADVITTYQITPGSTELLQQYSIKNDTYADEKNPWFVNYEDDDTSWESMTEDDYNERYENLNKEYQKLDFTPLSEIAPIDYSKVDLSKYPTFTKMLDDFKKGMGYANIKLGDTDVFLASSGTYTEDNNTVAAIDSSIFMYNDKGEIVYLGKVESAGTAYPLRMAEGCLFTCGHHNVDKTTVKDGKLVTVESASEDFDADGNATYYFGTKKVKDDSELTRLFDEYSKGELVEFSVENSTGMANPWRESSEEEIEKILKTDVIIPKDATNLYYQVMNDGEICEIDFDHMDLSYTYRLKASKELEDISGMYYEWDIEDKTDFHGCAAIDRRAVTDEETADLFQWYDKEKGITYSVSTTAKDLDGFDIQGIAELLYK